MYEFGERMFWTPLKVPTYIKAAWYGAAAGVIPRALHLAPLGATIECDQSGQVAGPDVGLPHPGGHLKMVNVNMCEGLLVGQYSE